MVTIRCDTENERSNIVVLQTKLKRSAGKYDDVLLFVNAQVVVGNGDDVDDAEDFSPVSKDTADYMNDLTRKKYGLSGY